MHDNQDEVLINGRKIHLMPKVDLKAKWIGNGRLATQLKAAWLVTHYDDRPMNPVIVGSPGCGKTTLVAALAAELQLDLYIFQCTMDTRAEDLLITPVLTEDKSVRYQASSLVTAMIRGGVCILDEGNRMRDKAWASLAPLLDNRRYVESIVTGSRIDAHKDFKIAATMNEDASVYNLPEYIKTRLRPRITVPQPDEAELRQIIDAGLPFIDEKVVEEVMKYLQMAQSNEKAFSPRQAVQLAALASKVCIGDPEADLEQTVAECAHAVADITLRSNGG